MLLFALTIFLSAFLLFQVQPVIAKIILPWFGGSAAVWTTCQLFFQLLLLAGYLYAHGLIKKARPSRQAMIHVALLAAACLALPILPNASWKPQALENPTLRILGLLTVTVGLPYFLLSATGPLLQAWFVQWRPGAIPYRLFALSNLGSMLGLLTYPPLVEPNLSLSHQAWMWSGAFAVFALICGFTAWTTQRQAHTRHVATEADESEAPITAGQLALWVLLAACPSMLLLGVTTHLSMDVASIPFLWILPLSLYLLTFILCFDAGGWYQRDYFLILSPVALGGMAWLAQAGPGDRPRLWITIVLYGLAFFAACMVCHGELSRLKPNPRRLTLYFLMISLGGALGGGMVAVIAPYVFKGMFELPLAIGFCGLLVLTTLYRDKESVFRTALTGWPSIFALVVMAALAGYLVRNMREEMSGSYFVARNFYGELKVRQTEGVYDWDGYRTLVHGTINHGEQYTHPARRKEIATYYCPTSGVGLVMGERITGSPQHVGVIGLGTGTLAGYARPGDAYRFYEINPLVQKIAKEHFWYLKDADTVATVVLGDARLSLEREPPQGFDILAVDAFSSDSIPVHLLTREAIELYFHHLRPDGVLAVHVSNRYIDLKPVLERAAVALHKYAVFVETEDDDDEKCFGTTWMLLSSIPDVLQKKSIWMKSKAPEPSPRQRLWTDDYSNLYTLLK